MLKNMKTILRGYFLFYMKTVLRQRVILSMLEFVVAPIYVFSKINFYSIKLNVGKSFERDVATDVLLDLPLIPSEQECFWRVLPMGNEIYRGVKPLWEYSMSVKGISSCSSASLGCKLYVSGQRLYPPPSPQPLETQNFRLHNQQGPVVIDLNIL